MVARLECQQQPPFQADPWLEQVAAFLTGVQGAVREVPWQALGRSDLCLVRRWAAESFTSEQARRLLLSLRRAVRTSRGSASGLDTAPSLLSEGELLASTRSRARPRPQSWLSARHVAALFDACDSDSGLAARRDAAVMALLLETGLRPGDVCGLQAGDYDETAPILIARGREPGSDRGAVLGASCDSLLRRWLEASGVRRGPLFRRILGNAASEEALSRQAVARLLVARCRQAGIAALTAGQLRARFLSGLRERVRLGQGQQALRYESMEGRTALLYLAPP